MSNNVSSFASTLRTTEVQINKNELKYKVLNLEVQINWRPEVKHREKNPCEAGRREGAPLML